MRRSVIAALAVAQVTAASPALNSRQSTGAGDCKDVHIFLSRGNNEPYPGRQGKLVEAICDGLSSCDYEDIQFYNPLESNFCEAVEEGAAAAIKQLNAYNKRCPDSKLVVSGYSQGAQVVGDALGGGGGTFFQGCVQKTNEPLKSDSSTADAIAAVLIFGDTRHTADQPYNFLDSKSMNGLFPRPGNQLEALKRYTDVTRAYCDAGDPICAQGDVVANHLNYFDIYSKSAAAWVQGLVGADSKPSKTSTTDAPTTTKASSTTKADAVSSTVTNPASTTIQTTGSSDPTASIDGQSSEETGSPSGDAEGASESGTEGDDGDDDSAAYMAKTPAVGVMLLALATFVLWQ